MSFLQLLFDVSGRFQHEHIIHLFAAHIFSVKAVISFHDKAFHGHIRRFGEEELGAAEVVVVVGRVAVGQGVHLVGKVGRDIFMPCQFLYTCPMYWSAISLPEPPKYVPAWL